MDVATFALTQRKLASSLRTRYTINALIVGSSHGLISTTFVLPQDKQGIWSHEYMVSNGYELCSMNILILLNLIRKLISILWIH